MANQHIANPYVSEQYLRLMADNLTDVVWMIDIETMRYVYVNSAVEALRGYSPQEAMAVELEAHLTPESYGVALKALEQALTEYRHGQMNQRTLELELRRKDGTTVWSEISTRLLAAPEGPLVVLGVTRDISSRKACEQEREGLIQKLQNALEAHQRLQSENQVLKELLPICSQCRRIRDAKGQWHDLEDFIAARGQIAFTHTLCAPCARDLYPELKL